MSNRSMRSGGDYVTFSYAFIGFVGAGFIMYLFSASRLSLTLYFFITRYVGSLELGAARILSMATVLAPIALIIAQAVASMLSLIRSAGLVGYTYLLYSVAVKTLIVTIPLAGTSSIGIDPETLLPVIDPIYIVMAVAAFTLVIAASYLGRKLPWVLISAYLKEGNELIPLGDAALRGESPVSILPGRSLIIKIVGIPEALRRTILNAIPPTAWEVSSSFRDYEIVAELRPRATGDGEVAIMVGNDLLGKIKTVLGSTLGFAKLIVEAIVSGKRSKVIETEHPVGMPLMYSIQRVRRFLPYGDIPLRKLVTYLVDNTMIPKPISLGYSNFEPGREYHIIVKKGGGTPEAPPSTISEEIIRVPLITPHERRGREELIPLTEEYRAKPIPEVPLAHPPEKPAQQALTLDDEFVNSCLELCGDIW